MMADEDNQVLWGLPIVETPDIVRSGKVITGRVEFHNFESIVQMMAIMSEAMDKQHPDEDWDELCAAYQVDPDEQRRFRVELRTALEEDEEE